MNFLELNKQYEEDTTINKENISEKLDIASRLHAKYHSYGYRWKRKLGVEEDKLKELYREKYKYYEKEYERALNDKEIKWHIDTDKEYISQNRKVEILKDEVDRIKDWCSHCNSLSYFYGNIIKWYEHMNGKN